ncbi:MAG: putative Na+/H+ antiporter [Azoarcus sp.]|jgi:Na+/H+ antiporter NhaD/arsenite permease-like protein|nr:putative Na+/H+ antiporter [Azoarcus sp.]
MTPTPIQAIGAALFAIAILHTFSVGFFARLAEKHPAHAGLWQLFAEVEFVFGFWAGILLLFIAFAAIGTDAGAFHAVTHYLDARNYTEPLFVLAIMIVAASKPVLLFASGIARLTSRLLPAPPPVAFYFTVLAVVPLLSSFITEPAAMALAALILKDAYYRKGMSSRLMYATLGVLFVNISIGGTLTNFAAPPVLMVAATWEWSSWFMLSNIGWRSAIAVLFNAAVVSLIFHKELARFELPGHSERNEIPAAVTALHLILLFLIVLFSHYPRVFLGVLLLFMAFAHAYPRFQERLILREGLMVSCFLGGLVTLGGQQSWWLQPLLSQMDASTVYYGATALTAITDNAALTYLGSLVQNLSDEFKYALVTGAVTGGGLTVIANAPNPAGMTILQGYFKGGAVNPAGLFANALPPTLAAILVFRLF